MIENFYLKTIATGSDGNCHLLRVDDEYLFLDLGVSKRKAQRAIEFEMDKLSGVIVTHRHIDHYYCVPEFEKMGINMFLPFEDESRPERIRKVFGNFVIDAYALTDIEGSKFVHTNPNGEECPIYSFVIRHKRYLNDFNLLYATDCQYIKWKFPGIHNILLGVDYAPELLDEDNPRKTEHQIWGHMSIDTACRFIEANKPDENVILTHLSATAADAEQFEYKVSKVCDCKVKVTKPRYHTHFLEERRRIEAL